MVIDLMAQQAPLPSSRCAATAATVHVRSHLLRTSNYFYRLLFGLCQHICKNLVVRRQAPDPQHRQWAEVVLGATLLRAERVGARFHCQHTKATKPHPSRTGHRQALAQEILAMANYNWAQRVPVHCCQGCCSSRTEAIEKFTKVAARGLYFFAFHAACSNIRHMGEHVRQVFAMRCTTTSAQNLFPSAC